jgi:hypothetical protein
MSFRGHRHPLRRVPLVTVIVPPEPLLTADQLDVALRLDLQVGDSPALERGDVEDKIAEATAMLDGPSGWLGRALGPQTLELSVETRGERFIELQFPPIISLVSIAYDDSDGNEQTLDPADYRLRRGAVYFTSTAPDSEDMRIRYRAGYSDGNSPEGANVPRNVLAALKLMVGDLWENRQGQVIGSGAAIINPTVEALLAGLKLYSIA